jgi:TFIIF-interacting CTD phosphatase-like protein
VFKDEFPRNDARFCYDKLNVYVCFRHHLETFLRIASNCFELIAWTSAQESYTQHLIEVVEGNYGIKFEHVLSLSDQSKAEDTGEDLYVKSLELLSANRFDKNIIIVDNRIANFTNRLTNGIWLPPYRLH